MEKNDAGTSNALVEFIFAGKMENASIVERLVMTTCGLHMTLSATDDMIQ